MATLSRFWLLNGSKKKGKKSVKKVAKKVIKKVTKKSAKKKVSLLPSVIKTSTVKRKVKRTRPIIKEKVFIPEIVNITKKVYKTKKSKGVKTMAKRVKRVKRTKLAKNKAGVFMAKNWKKSIGKVHRISAKYDRAGILRTSRKSKIAKKSYRINPIKFNVKSITKSLTPMAMLTATGIGSIIALNKVMPMIPYVKNLSGATKAVAKVGIGTVASILVKKYLKNDVIANGLLLGSMISALAQYINISEQGKILIPQTTQGIKVMGNPLSFGRPKTVLGTPNFQMNGIKVKNANGIKLAPKAENVDGIERW